LISSTILTLLIFPIIVELLYRRVHGKNSLTAAAG
jgi:Cu/Ag efflux pump CusA